MTFVYPTFLWALLAILVPVIIHLFNFRRYKKVYFTNVRFLRELQEESKSKSRLKEILILIARCLAIACIALAFAQPVLPDRNQEAVPAGARAVGIYIDNSFSMDNVQKQGPLIEIAKQHAKSIVKAFGEADRFQLLTNDFEGKHQRFYSREDLLRQIDEVKISSSVRPLSDVLKRLNDFLAGSQLGARKAYVLSDAQKSTFNLAEVRQDSSVKTSIIPLKANQVNNVYIDTCWFDSPLQQKGFIQKLHAVVVNNGSNPVSAGSAKLFLNKQQLALASFSVEAFSEKEIQFTFECRESGFNYGSVKIEDYPVTFDDELFFAFSSMVNISVCLINGKDNEEQSFESMFRSDSLFRLFQFNEQSVDYSRFKLCDVVVLNQLSSISSGLLSELDKFIRQGGSLLIVPHAKCDQGSYNLLLSTFRLPAFAGIDTMRMKTEKIEHPEKFYSGVFEKLDERMNLPLVNRHYRLLQATRSNYEALLTLQNGDPLLIRQYAGDGTVYLFTAPFDQSSSNLSRHALTVPTVYRICFSALRTSSLFYEVNANNILHFKGPPGAGEEPPHIREINKQLDIIPEMHAVENSLLLYTRSQITAPGFYEVIKNKEPLLPLAFNYSRKESDLQCYSSEELANILLDKNLKQFSILEAGQQQDISRLVMQEAQGRKLWKLFIILALSFLIIEILLLRFLK